MPGALNRPKAEAPSRSSAPPAVRSLPGDRSRRRSHAARARCRTARPAPAPRPAATQPKHASAIRATAYGLGAMVSPGRVAGPECAVVGTTKKSRYQRVAIAHGRTKGVLAIRAAAAAEAAAPTTLTTIAALSWSRPSESRPFSSPVAGAADVQAHMLVPPPIRARPGLRTCLLVGVDIGIRACGMVEGRPRRPSGHELLLRACPYQLLLRLTCDLDLDRLRRRHLGHVDGQQAVVEAGLDLVALDVARQLHAARVVAKRQLPA